MQLVESMGVKVVYLIIVQVKNSEVIFMSNNITTSSHTNHIDIH